MSGDCNPRCCGRRNAEERLRLFLRMVVGKGETQVSHDKLPRMRSAARACGGFPHHHVRGARSPPRRPFAEWRLSPRRRGAAADGEIVETAGVIRYENGFGRRDVQASPKG
jgi:hypothetical protein